LGDIAVFADFEAVEVEGLKQLRRQLVAQEVLGDFAPAEALAEEDVVGVADGVHGGVLSPR